MIARTRRLLLLPLLLFALSAGGCAAIDKIRDVAGAATATITNPIGKQELAKIEVAYEVALAVSVSYRRFCYSKPLAELPQSVCGNRRAIILRMQRADTKAFAAISAARKFVAENPTISAVSLITAARQAVTDFTSETQPVAASI
jgi:hypothetical protein